MSMPENETEVLPGYRKMSKARFVERMLRDAERAELERKEKQRQQERIINDYISSNIVHFKHRMHMKTRGKR